MDITPAKTKWMQALDVAVSGHAIEHLKPPHIKFLQLPDISHWQDQYILIEWQATDEIYQGGGMVFGGYISALADYAAGTAMLTSIADEDLFATHKLSVEYKKPIRAGRVLIKAEVVTKADKFFDVVVSFTNADGELCAVAEVKQTILNMSRKSR